MDLILFRYYGSILWAPLVWHLKMLSKGCSNDCHDWSLTCTVDLRDSVFSSLWQVTVVIYRYLSHNLAVKLTMSIACFILFLIIMFMFFLYTNEKKFQGIFLQYAGLFLSENPYVLLYIPLYLLLTLGLVALIVWQHCCFSSKYGQSKNFFNFNNMGVF